MDVHTEAPCYMLITSRQFRRPTLREVVCTRHFAQMNEDEKTPRRAQHRRDESITVEPWRGDPICHRCRREAMDV